LGERISNDVTIWQPTSQRQAKLATKHSSGHAQRYTALYPNPLTLSPSLFHTVLFSFIKVGCNRQNTFSLCGSCVEKKQEARSRVHCTSRVPSVGLYCI